MAAAWAQSRGGFAPLIRPGPVARVRRPMTTTRRPQTLRERKGAGPAMAVKGKSGFGFERPLPFSEVSLASPEMQKTLPIPTEDDDLCEVFTELPEGGQQPTFGVASTQGPREAMEDTGVVVPDARCGYLYAAVFDGHQGDYAGDYLKDELYARFSKIIDLDNEAEASPEGLEPSGSLCCPLSLTPAITAAFAAVDRELIKKQESKKDLSGATATIVMVRWDRIVVANVGDSRAVLGKSGRATSLTAEHRPPPYGNGDIARRELKRIEAAGGWVDDGRICGVLAVARSFGDREFKGTGRRTLLETGVREGWLDARMAAGRTLTDDLVVSTPDVYELKRSAQDEFIVLGSDGLWDVISNADCYRLVLKELGRPGGSALSAAKLLVNEASVIRRSDDNVYVVLVDLRFTKGGTPPPPPSKQLARASKPKNTFGNLFGLK